MHVCVCMGGREEGGSHEEDGGSVMPRGVPHTTAAAHLDPQIAQQALLLVVVDALLAQLILHIGAAAGAGRGGASWRGEVRTPEAAAAGGGGGEAHGRWTPAISSSTPRSTLWAAARPTRGTRRGVQGEPLLSVLAQATH